MRRVMIEISESQAIWLDEQLQRVNYNGDVMFRKVLNFAIQNESAFKTFLSGREDSCLTKP